MSSTLVQESADEQQLVDDRVEVPCPARHIGYVSLLQNTRTSIPLVCSDLAAITIAAGFAYLMCFTVNAAPARWQSLVGLVVAMPILFFLLELYPAVGIHPAVELKRTIVAIASLYVGILVTVLVVGQGIEIVTVLLLACGGCAVLVPGFRLATRSVMANFDWWCQPTLIIGSDRYVDELTDEMKSRRSLGLRPVQPTPGSVNASATRVLLAPGVGDASHVHEFPYTSIVSPSLASFHADGICDPGVPRKNRLKLPVYRFLKRLTDFALILVALPVLTPIVVITAVAVKVTSHGPLFYTQQRVGRGGRHFRAWKFRTMVVDADEVLDRCLHEDPELLAEWKQDHKLRNDPRVTPIGEFLRTTSLDELPQLWNVIRGEMSLVGPRPIPYYEAEKYLRVSDSGLDQYGRVLPGVTGLWQVSGRNDTSYEQRIAFDQFYVANWSIWLDFYILLRTVKAVLWREGAY